MSLTRLKPTGINNAAEFSMANLAITGNLEVNAIKTDNILHANGVAHDFTTYPAGSNTQIAFNDAGVFGSNANLTFNKSTTTLATDNVVSQNLTGNIVTATQSNITTVGTLVSLSVTGNIVSGNVSGGNLVSANYISGNGSQLSSITGANVTGQVGNALVAGTVYTNAQPNITSVGILDSLTVTGDSTVGGNLTVTGNLTISGTTTTINSTTITVNDLNLVLANNASTALAANGAGISINGAAANLLYNSSSNSFVSSHPITANGSLLTALTGANVTGQVANSLIAGTVYTNAQPNITSVGTLSNVNVGGEAIVGNLASAGIRMRMVESGGAMYIQAGNGVLSSANTINFAPWYSGTSTMSVDLVNRRVGIKKAAPTVELDVAGAGAFTGNVNAAIFIGAGNNLSNIQGANVTGQVSNSLIAGTVYTAAQPNITSVGTLSSLAISSWFSCAQATETVYSMGAVAGSTVNYDMSNGATFYHSSVTLGANWTVNLQNVPTTDAKSIIVTIMVVQGSTSYIPNVLQIDGTTQTIKWPGGITPFGKADSVDVFSFGLIRTGATWAHVLGSYSTYS